MFTFCIYHIRDEIFPESHDDLTMISLSFLGKFLASISNCSPNTKLIGQDSGKVRT